MVREIGRQVVVPGVVFPGVVGPGVVVSEVVVPEQENKCLVFFITISNKFDELF